MAKRSIDARIARFIIFKSTAYLPGPIGIALRRKLRAKYMPKKKTAPKYEYVSPHLDLSEDEMPYMIPRIDL